MLEEPPVNSSDFLTSIILSLTSPVSFAPFSLPFYRSLISVEGQIVLILSLLLRWTSEFIQLECHILIFFFLQRLYHLNQVYLLLSLHSYLFTQYQLLKGTLFWHTTFLFK